MLLLYSLDSLVLVTNFLLKLDADRNALAGGFVDPSLQKLLLTLMDLVETVDIWELHELSLHIDFTLPATAEGLSALRRISK